MKALKQLCKSFIKVLSWKLYHKKLYKSFIKRLSLYIFLKEHVDILTTLWLGALYTSKMWLNEYFLNSDLVTVKEVWTCIRKM